MSFLSPSSSRQFAVTVFPRGAAGTRSGLVHLELPGRRVLSAHVGGDQDALVDPATGRPGLLRHMRGLTTYRDRLLVGAFNCVNSYTRASDGDEFRLEWKRRYTHPGLCDVHGIRVCDDRLYAASTGSDSVVRWDLDDASDVAIFPLGDDEAANRRLNFPERLVTGDESLNWRTAVCNRLHVNDVNVRGTSLLVTSLHAVTLRPFDGTQATELYRDPDGILHDASLLDDSVLLTNARTGELLRLDLHSGQAVRSRIVDPSECFLRGLAVDGPSVWLLGSERVSNRQLSTRTLTEEATNVGGCSFRLFCFDLDRDRVCGSWTFATEMFPQGSVVYAIQPLTRSYGGLEGFWPAAATCSRTYTPGPTL
jgi:hypothetical protein